MVGIAAFGAYVPVLRLNRDEIAKAWESASLGGQKALANHDEDSLTMAVAATIDCLADRDRHAVDGLYFASTTSPYREKQVAAVAAAASNLRRDIATADFTDSLRSATIALRAAVDALKAGSARQIVVAAADCRLGAPGSSHEQLFGDAAAALLVDNADPVATLEETFHLSDDFSDLWRTEGDAFPRSWEERFTVTLGYQRVMGEAIRGVLTKANVAPGELARLVISGPDARSHAAAAKAAGIDIGKQLQDGLFGPIGNPGVAQPFIGLTAALEEASPGDLILLAAYGDGADAYLFRVTERIKDVRPLRGVKGHLAHKLPVTNYQKYLRLRRLLEGPAARRPGEATSLPALWRGQREILAFYGGKCRSCGTVQYPIQRVCAVCQSKDQYDEVLLSNRRGRVFTYTLDNLATSIDPPTVMSVVDLDGGGRIYCQLTDRDPEEVKVDLPIEMTFRRIHDAGGYHNYWWKAKPVR